MKKYIFLDIDGVLATDREFMMNRNKFIQKNPWARELHVPYGWNKDCVKIFNEILEATYAKIILSSDWRLHWNMDELDVIFKGNGVIKSPEGATGISKRKLSSDLEDDRSWQIKNYVNADVPERWVAIDDLTLTSLGENFVQTRSSEGLKQTGLKDKIIKKLNHE
jgi:HAD domain in Swiss Army Knife RNA repair proteins